MSETTRRRLIMIAMDAAEATLVERWIADGSLPNLERLRERGASGRLESPAQFLNAAAWPTFVAGIGPARNGIYNYLLWDPDDLSYVRPGPELPDLPPFWRRAARECGLRSIVLDVPYVYPAEEFEGLELHGWAGHYKLVPTFTLPPEWLDQVQREFGEAPIEGYGPGLLPVRKYFEVRDTLVDASHRATEMAATLIEREPWDLFLISLSATHSGGHQLWDSTNVRGTMSAEEADELGEALKALYVESDRAIGRLLEAAGPDTACLVFALHGMGANTGLGAILPEMLDRVLAGGPPEDEGEADRPSLLKRLREAVPVEWRSAVKRRLPAAVQDWLTLFWRRSSAADWSVTRAFCLLPDREGFVRVNLAGREAQGIVEPGREFDELLAEIREGLSSFVFSDTGEPAIYAVSTPEELMSGIAPQVRRRLPDLVVHWTDRPAADVPAVSSPRFGTVAWPKPGFATDGQSGHHRGAGWFVAGGAGVRSGTLVGDATVADLSATALDLLGCPVPEEFDGRPLPVFEVEP
ncbi:MAG: alkaline phosphatase family protein [Gemmatimonadales bacterium]